MAREDLFKAIVDKPKKESGGSRREVTTGDTAVIRTSDTTSGIAEGSIDVEPAKKVIYRQTRRSAFTSDEEGNKLKQGTPGNLGLRCEASGNTYQHGEEGPEAKYFVSRYSDNPLTTTPHAVCSHHLNKILNSGNTADIKVDNISPNDIQKHKDRLLLMKDTARAHLESLLLNGELSVSIPADAPKPPKNVTLPPADLLWGRETHGGAVVGTRGPSLKTHLDEANSRRTNEEKESILNYALKNLRNNYENNTEESNAEHVEKYHSPDSVLEKDELGREYCPVCSSEYARTVENAALDELPSSPSKKIAWSFDPVNIEGVLRRPGWNKQLGRPDDRNAKSRRPAPAPRVGRSLPKEAGLESVDYINKEDWERSVVPAHLFLAEGRAATPVERFAEGQLNKQVSDLTVGADQDATSALMREREAFRNMSPREQIAYRRKKHLEEFGQGSGKPELESGNE